MKEEIVIPVKAQCDSTESALSIDMQHNGGKKDKTVERVLVLCLVPGHYWHTGIWFSVILPKQQPNHLLLSITSVRMCSLPTHILAMRQKTYFDWWASIWLICQDLTHKACLQGYIYFEHIFWVILSTLLFSVLCPFILECPSAHYCSGKSKSSYKKVP